MTPGLSKYIPGWVLYSSLFLAIMIAFNTIGWWRASDWWAYQHLSADGKGGRLAEDIVIVDISYSDNNETFRATVVALLGELARDRIDGPKGVVLDIAVTSDIRGIDPLIEAVDLLRANNIKVFAGVDPRRENSAALDPKYMERYYENLYVAHLDGLGHTYYKRHSYIFEPYLELDVSTPSIPSLATTIAESLYGRKPSATDEMRLVHPVGMTEMLEHTRAFRDGRWYTYPQTGEAQPIPRPSFRGKLVIVGCLEKDKDPDTSIPGTMFIAWELNDYILPSDYDIVSPELNFITILLAVLVTMLVFSGLVRTGKRISIHPAWLALVSGTAGLLAIAACIGLLLLTKSINPYVTMPAFGALLSAGLAGRHWHAVIGERAFMKRRDEWLAPPAHQYDLFISYSHEPENAEWVRKNVFEPLCAARKFDGTCLRIFFDTQSIKVGDSWHRKITRSIYLSRHFLPVYSFDYFKRDYCNYEMDHAAEINVHNKNFIMPVVHELPIVPDEYRLIQYRDSKDNPAFLEEIINQLTKYPG